MPHTSVGPLIEEASDEECAPSRPAYGPVMPVRLNMNLSCLTQTQVEKRFNISICSMGQNGTRIVE
jgi:hypothetical protein